MVYDTGQGGKRGDKLRGFGEVGRPEQAARWTVWAAGRLSHRHMASLIAQTGGELAALFEVGADELKAMLEAADCSNACIERVDRRVSTTNPNAAYADELDRLPADTCILQLGQAAYPNRLVDLAEPPVFLYVRGPGLRAALTRTVAMVGSREVTVDGARRARRMAKRLGQAGAIVISGGAIGVDAAAHRGCLEAEMRTISVLAGGVERPTPRRNAGVFETIIDRGAIVSEYPIGTKPRRFSYHRRNALIAALGDATVVIRAGQHSGTMITARAANDLNRPLCALPGGLGDPLAEGCHQLLVDGAQCVRTASDVLEVALQVPERGEQLSLSVPARRRMDAGMSAASAPSPPRRSPDLDGVSDAARQLFEDLRKLAGPNGDGVGLDPLKRAVDWPLVRLNSALLELELAGAIAKRAGANTYRPLSHQ